MLLASGHHRIMAAARGALVMMVFGKVIVCSRPLISVCLSAANEIEQSRRAGEEMGDRKSVV